MVHYPKGRKSRSTLEEPPYPSGNPNVQIGVGKHPIPGAALNIMVVITFTPYGNCGISMIIAGDIAPGTSASRNMDAFVGESVGCTDLSDPVGTGLTGTLTLEQADGQRLRGTFDLTQAFEEGSLPLTATGRFVVSYLGS